MEMNTCQVSRSSGLAITSFILSLVGIIALPLLILSFIFGLIAIRQINKSQGRLIGRGLAIAGVTISSVFFTIIVAIVIIVVIPLTRGRIDDAKWSEGRAMMGTISTGVRAYRGEMGPDGRPPRTLRELSFVAGDLDGIYFGDSDFAFSVSSMNPLTS